MGVMALLPGVSWVKVCSGPGAGEQGLPHATSGISGPCPSPGKFPGTPAAPMSRLESSHCGESQVSLATQPLSWLLMGSWSSGQAWPLFLGR